MAIKQLTVSAEHLNLTDTDLQSVARSLNILNSQIIYTTNTTSILDGILNVYDSTAQKSWGMPILDTAGETIQSVVGDLLTTNPISATYALIDIEEEAVIEVVARGLNILDSQISGENNGLEVKEYLFSTTQKKTYSVPALAIGKFIDSVSTDQLTTTEPTVYTMLPIATNSFSSITDVKSKSSTLSVGQLIRSPLTKWRVTDSATYTLPYANRVKVFNSLDVGNGKYLQPCGDIIYASDFLDDSVTASNDLEVGEISSIMRDGIKLDFSGKMFRVFGSTTGIISSTANPVTDRAQLLTEMLFLDDLQDISFGKGGLYAADQGTTGVKNYFPSTLYLKNCIGVHFEQGSIFESKGESWGDSDDSVSLSKDDRQDFLGQNGGHAVVFVRCKTATGSPTCRLAGSVGPLYFSSTEDVRLTSPFSNSASLGYASYSFDAWCGDTTESGLDNFHGTISNPQAYAETLTRREDGVSVGSSIFCGKGGVITEDRDVEIATQGGYISDMYANGSNKTLGYAFGAGVFSLCTNVGAIVRNCQEVCYIAVSAEGAAECRVTEVDAVVGLTGIMFADQSFGICRGTLKGKVRVNNSRSWVGEVETLENTSLVASMKPASKAFAVIDCDAAADENPPAASLGILFTIISNKNEATYGGVVIEGGNYLTDGYLIRSEGWGPSAAGEKTGLIIKPGTVIRDFSSAATDGFIQYQNESGGAVFTYIYHDIQGANMSVNGFRSLNAGYTITGAAALKELQLFPRKLGETTYTTIEADRPKETVEIEFTQSNGLAGPNSKMEFVMTNGRPLRVNAWLNSDTGLVKILAINTVVVAGPLRSELLLEGDVRANFTALDGYVALGA